MAQTSIDKKTVSKPIISKSKSRQKYDMELVKGIFRFNEVPGGELKFSYKKYKGMGSNYSLRDGQTYEIPRCVAQHLIKAGSYPVHEYQTDVNGRPIIRIGRTKRRYSFDSLEFFDDLDSTESGIVTAKRI